MSGSDVRVLQRLLTQAGYLTPASGSFGATTEKQVVSFERGQHLALTGVVDAAFVRQLHQAVAERSIRRGAAQDGYSGGATYVIAPAPKSRKRTQNAGVTPSAAAKQLGGRVLRPGMKGADVTQLQGDLTVAGFPTIIDGQFGSSTRTSVVAFEKAHGLPATGVVGPTVAQRLQSAVVANDGSRPTATARINPDGTATAPVGAPPAVQAVIAAANQITHKPYVHGGGHGIWNDVGYDCSGAVSYALHGGGLLASPEDSTELERYGESGPGTWITIYADAAHTWVVVAGIAFDTADFGGPNIPSGTGPRWRTDPVGNLGDGGNYAARHPTDL